MTIKEYQTELAKQINKLSTDLKNPISREQSTGLNIALVLSKELYKTYPFEEDLGLTEFMTHRQLAELLARGYGQVMALAVPETEHDYGVIEEQWSYWDEDDEDAPVAKNIRIRQWGSDHWLKPFKTIYDKYFEIVPKVQNIEFLLKEDCK